MRTILIFTLLQFANVIFSTIRSILTIKGSKMTATLSNALYFGYYTIVLVFTVQNFPLWIKVLVTTLTNFVGVYLVKLFEEKKKKDRLWRIDSTIDYENYNAIADELKNAGIGYTAKELINSDKCILNCYCYTQADSEFTIKILNRYNCKYFVIENRLPF